MKHLHNTQRIVINVAALEKSKLAFSGCRNKRKGAFNAFISAMTDKYTDPSEITDDMEERYRAADAHLDSKEKNEKRTKNSRNGSQGQKKQREKKKQRQE